VIEALLISPPPGKGTNSAFFADNAGFDDYDSLSKTRWPNLSLRALNHRHRARERTLR